MTLLRRPVRGALRAYLALRACLLAALALGAAGCGATAPAAPAVCKQRQQGLPIHALQCGPALDFTPIHKYRGEVAGIEDREEAIGLINGTCTGTLIAAKAGPVVLTAGHCVGLGDRSVLAFNVEEEPDGDPLVTEGTVIEHGTDPDYALIRLDALPAVTPISLGTRSSDLLAIIQHPRGRPKVIAEGRFLDACDGLIYYADLDTLVGSSGAGVLNRQGHLIAVHTDGDCQLDGGGANWGWTAARIVEVSPYLQAVDLADR